MSRQGSTGRRRWLRWSLLIGWVGLIATGPAGASAQEAAGSEDALAASTRTVNVELVLDASGSMAETIAGTDESRIEAARRAMAEVIGRIPERDGFNVGFRVYGHEGSNREADRALSCRSTELLVPIAGVDKAALREQVVAFAPTGWTPLALALEEAAADFEPGGESVTNAVIMVTDGEETCGGDPCAVAGELNAAEIGLTTHVVGFALTAEQREAVRCIAEEGGGRLFAAEDAGELSEAVFAAIQEVEADEADEVTPAPVETATEVGGYVAGNAFGLLEPCPEGELSVVAVGPYETVGLPVVICNGTGEDVESIAVEAVARAGGELVGSGDENLSLNPNLVEAGGVALGTIFFGGQDLPDGVEFEFDLDAEPAGDDPRESGRDLIVEEVNAAEEGVVGILRNPHADGVVTVDIGVACFDAAGDLTEYASTVPAGTIAEAVEPDETIVFEVGIGGPIGPLAGPCPAFLVAAGGSGAP